MKRLPVLLLLLALLALGAACTVPAGPSGEAVPDSSKLSIAGHVLDLSVMALESGVGQLKASHPDKAQALDEKTAPALAGAKIALAAYHAAVAAGDSTQSTDARWAAVKSALGEVIDAAMPIVGGAAMAALGL
ncbi:hypothetical protein [Fundidesulfovibrio putealis]|uniref:hypothetical protein n=1 Tax=Fundidesulfovibrio putealis TaxID=270496 RepID=UPI00041138EC|nr:hypothetical protein [Fundidesulfovibrio putealis]